MKAVYCTAYGSPEVLKMVDLPKPTPQANELLIRIHATAVNSGDVRIRKADPWAVRLFFGFSKPKKPILGGVFSGEVVEIGTAVTRFKVGDAVFGSTGMSFGAYAEFKAIKETAALSLKPESVSHTEAAIIPFGAMTALHFIRKAGIQPGQKVLIYGASGAVGSAAVQLAKSFGAEVTAVCSASNADLMKQIGADSVINYQKEKLSVNNTQYDLIYEAVNKLSFSQSIKHLKKGGVLILGAAGLPQMLRAGFARMSGRKVLTGVIKESAEGMNLIKDLIDDGKYQPVLDRTYTLNQIASAHAYVDLGHKKGNVGIQVTAD
ncbi:NAD(P)-dependent alcohol dehydrogenase [Fluviicola sp.]|uniref:NAD(P)-dependent alcohol dehydrogenase n=1 Tax=Fluviicola sp. TaxID=1917219 RepID=UPI003D29791C